MVPFLDLNFYKITDFYNFFFEILFRIYISGAEGRASLFLKVKAGEVSSGFENLFDPGRDKNDARPES